MIPECQPLSELQGTFRRATQAGGGVVPEVFQEEVAMNKVSPRGLAGMTWTEENGRRVPGRREGLDQGQGGGRSHVHLLPVATVTNPYKRSDPKQHVFSPISEGQKPQIRLSRGCALCTGAGGEPSRPCPSSPPGAAGHPWPVATSSVLGSVVTRPPLCLCVQLALVHC